MMNCILHIKKAFLLIFLLLLFTGCTSQKQAGKQWLCTVQIPERSEKSVLCDTVFQTESEELSIQNHANIDIRCCLFDIQNLEESIRTLDVEAGGVGTMYEIDTEKRYQIGIQATVPEKIEVELLISEYPSGELYEVK